MDVWYLILAIVMTGFVGIYCYLCRRANYFEERGVPYVEPRILFGNVGPHFFRKTSYAENVQRLYNRYRDLKYVGIFDFSEPVILLRDLELIKSVTIKNFDHFTDHRPIVDVHQDSIFANNLFALCGERWREVRRHLSSVHTSSKLKLMFSPVSRYAKHLADHLEKQSLAPVELELKHVFSKFANDVIAYAAFGIQVDSLGDEENDFYKMSRLAAKFDGNRTIKVFLARDNPYLARLFNLKIFSDDLVKFFVNLIELGVARREGKQFAPRDLIDVMMQARDDDGKLRLSVEDMTSQAFVFLLAGFDTSSTLMSLVVHQVAAHPSAQDKLCAEIDSMLKKCDNGDPTYDAILGMRYLDAVIKETMRLYPPVAVMNRACVKSFELPPASPNSKPLTVEPGTTIWIPCYSIQRDPLYFDRPDEFDPERFGPENAANVNPATFFPFGLGPRFCIANRFALMEVKLGICHLFAKCKFSPCSKTSIPLKLNREILDISSEKGFWLRVENR